MPWLLSTRLNLPPPGLEECSKINSRVMHQSLVLEQEAKPALARGSHDNKSYLDWTLSGHNGWFVQGLYKYGHMSLCGQFSCLCCCLNCALIS